MFACSASISFQGECPLLSRRAETQVVVLGQATGQEPEKSRARLLLCLVRFAPPAVVSACCFPFSLLSRWVVCVCWATADGPQWPWRHYGWGCIAPVNETATGPNGHWANIRTEMLLSRGRRKKNKYICMTGVRKPLYYMFVLR